MSHLNVEDVLESAETALRECRFADAEVEALNALAYVRNNSDKPTEESALRESKALRLLSMSYWQRGLGLEAMGPAQSAVQLMSPYIDSPEYVLVLNNLGVVHAIQCDHVGSLKLWGEALARARELGMTKAAATTSVNMGHAYYQTTQYEQALQYYRDGQRAFEMLGEVTEVADITGNIGNILYQQSDFSGALEHHSIALDIARRLGNKHAQAIHLGNIGLVYKDISDYPRALQYLGEALEVNLQIGNQHGQALQYANIGNLYNRLHDTDRALEYMNRSAEIFASIGSLDSEAREYGNIATVYLALNDYPNANLYFKRAYDIFEAQDLKLELAKCLQYLGRTLSGLFEFEEARGVLERACHDAETLGLHSTYAEALVSLGEHYFYSNNPHRDIERAESYLLEGLLANKQYGSKFFVSHTHQLLSALYKEANRWPEYSEHIEQYLALQAEIANTEITSQADRFGWERKLVELEGARKRDSERTQALTKEVEAAVHELVRKNNLLEDLKRKVKKLKEYTRGEGLEISDRLEQKLERNTVSIDDKRTLEVQFEALHAPFIDKLRTTFPELTQMELKIAALLRMNLTTSNIASVMCISKRTVEFHRLNLRKKLGLASEQDLHTTLVSL